MIAWAMKHIGWFIIRLVVTLACMFTIKNAAHHEGYYIDYNVLLVCTVCLIIGVRFWMPTCRCNQHKQSNKETTWGGKEGE
jgi:hypothetical protein